MLNRRILRIKVFKVLYSYSENPTMTLKEALSQLDLSCEATRDLYLFMLGIISPLTSEAKRSIEALKGKFNPTEEEKNPNMKFANNKLAPLLDSDPDFQKLLTRKKLSWDQYDALISNLYVSIKSKDYYQAYMSSSTSSLAEDVKLFIKIFEEEFVDNDALYTIMEDKSIYWNEDLGYSLTYCCRSLQDMAKGKAWNLPPLYKSDMLKEKDPLVESDKAFSVKLMKCAFSGYEKYFNMIAEAVPKWDKDRLFATDLAIIATGLAEAQNFPEIPVKVTINEYVEISKYYSTPKSHTFVNGLLDRLIQKMAADGLMHKEGKGLL
jgi:N utilization substance protein B